MSSQPTLYCTFRTAGRLFGVPILDVREVTTETACTRIPHAPPEVAGYVNIRGHIHLALDLSRMLGLPGDTGGRDRRLVLFQAAVGPAFGVLVDEIGDIVSVDGVQTEEFSNSLSDVGIENRGDLFVRICKLPEELLAVLEPHRFLPFVEKALSTT